MRGHILNLAVVVCSLSVWGAQPQDVWIISGQSNAEGKGKLPGPPPDPKVQVYDLQKNVWVTAEDPLAILGSPGVGPWVAAGQAVAKAGITIRLMGETGDGQPIGNWDAQSGNFQLLSANIKKCAEGAGVFLWYQGESDAAAGMDTAAYQAKLKDLVARVRAAAKNPNMLAVIIQVGVYTTGCVPIREAERRFVIEDGNALLLPALGRTLGDTVHLNTPGYKELGQEIARALLKNRYGKKDVKWPGPVMDSAVLAEDGKTVFAHFAAVKKLGGCLAADFAVVDGKGQIQCVKVQPEGTCVTFTLERAATLPARLIYGVGMHPTASLVDEAGNRAPGVELDLITGGPPADKETPAPNGAGLDARKTH